MSEPVQSKDAPPWRTRYTLLIYHPSAPWVLLMPEDGGLTLPRWEVAARHWFKDTAELNRGLREYVGLDGIVLRYVERREDEGARLVTAYCVVECRSEEWRPPPDWRWIGRDELGGTALRRPEQRPVLTACLDEAAGGPVPPGRNAYATRGWFGGASRWMEAQLRAAGRAPLGPVEQVKTWGISCVLRAPTREGDVYLKAPSRHFAREAPVTALLAAWYPDRLPGVVAIEARHGWLLLEDVGAPLFRETGQALWEQALDLYAELQRGCTARADALLRAGAADRSLGVLREQIGPLAEAPEVIADAAPELVDRLVRAAPRLRALCDELALQGVPATLVHGDLHGGNVGVRDGRVRFFDWTDACVSHPFIDLVTLLPTPERDADAHARLRDRYLAGFEDVAPAERLRRAFELAWCLGTVHQVVSYVGIARSLEPGARTEFGGALASWLRKGLERAELLGSG
jgi:hypothetical protein